MTDEAFERRAHAEIIRLREENEHLRRENDALREELVRRDDALYTIGKAVKKYEDQLRPMAGWAARS